MNVLLEYWRNGSIQTGVAILLLAFGAAFTSFDHLQLALAQIRPLGSDEITAFEERTTPMRAHLPPRGIVGYTTDRIEGSLKEYCLMAYSLCPVVPILSLDYPLVIGNFSHPYQLLPISKNPRFVVVTDLKNGIVLFRKQSQ